jgi:hypothetical protein
MREYGDRLINRRAGGSAGLTNQGEHVHEASDRHDRFHKRIRNTPRPLCETSKTGTKKSQIHNPSPCFPHVSPAPLPRDWQGGSPGQQNDDGESDFLSQEQGIMVIEPLN